MSLRVQSALFLKKFPLNFIRGTTIRKRYCLKPSRSIWTSRILTAVALPKFPTSNTTTSISRPGKMTSQVRSVASTDGANKSYDSRSIKPKCIFCKILSDKLPSSQVYQDDICRIIMDIHPIQRGHVLIIPRQHYENIMDMPEDVAMHMTMLASKLTTGLTHEGTQSQFQCNGANLLWNNGRAAWQTVLHAHLHVIPRRRGDSFGFLFGLVRHMFSLLGILPATKRQELDKIAAIFHNVLSKQMKSS